MPQSRSKPSEIAAEAKRMWMPHIYKHYIKDATAQTAYHYPDSSAIKIHPSKRDRQRRTRVAVIEGDPVDYTLGWYEYVSADPNYKESRPIPVVNMANEKRAGGDWESGLMAPEECFARRSNLVHALTMPWNPRLGAEIYPIQQRGGVYCPTVYVFRSNAEANYVPYSDPKELPVISVAPVRRPKLDETGSYYSFAQEKELMREKMRTVLRIASWVGNESICIGAFGIGPIFRNPVGEVASMWRKLLFDEEEFKGVFTDVVFCIENNGPSKGSRSDADVFRDEFDPSAIFPTRYR